MRTVSSWSGNKERRDQQSQREDTKNTYFLGPCCVLWYSTTSPVVKGVAEEVWAGEVPGSPSPPLPEQTTLFGTYTEKIQAREAYRTFLFVCTKNITTGRAGDIFLMQVFVCMVNCLKKGGLGGWVGSAEVCAGGWMSGLWVGPRGCHSPSPQPHSVSTGLFNDDACVHAYFAFMIFTSPLDTIFSPMSNDMKQKETAFF